MAKADGVFVYVGTYPDEMSARDDYEIVKDLHAAGAVGTYDASVVTKDENGKVHVNKDETSHASRRVGRRRGRCRRRHSVPTLAHWKRDCRRGCRRRGRPFVEGHVSR